MRSFWGWGHAEEALDEGERRNLAERLAPLLGTGLESARPPALGFFATPAGAGFTLSSPF